MLLTGAGPGTADGILKGTTLNDVLTLWVPQKWTLTMCGSERAFLRPNVRTPRHDNLS